jgi:hypothetical protein
LKQIITPQQLAVLLHEEAAERDPYGIEVNFPQGMLRCTFEGYGPAMFYQNTGGYYDNPWRGTALEIIARQCLGIKRPEEFDACLMYYTQFEWPADWYDLFVDIITRRHGNGIADAFNPMNIIFLMSEEYPGFANLLNAEGLLSADKSLLILKPEDVQNAINIALGHIHWRKIFIGHGLTFNAYGTVLDYSDLLEDIAANVDEIRFIGDFGSGFGQNAAILAKHFEGALVYAIERQLWQDTRGRNLDTYPANLHFIQGNILRKQDLPLLNVAILGAVIGHFTLEAAEKLMQLIYEQLAEGGIVVCAPQQMGMYGYQSSARICRKVDNGFVELDPWSKD